VLFVLVTFAFSSHPWLTACCEKEAEFAYVFPARYSLSTVRTMWSRYGIPLEVADGNLESNGSKQNYRVLEETRPLNARHA
jgi:hypothetical protein